MAAPFFMPDYGVAFDVVDECIGLSNSIKEVYLLHLCDSVAKRSGRK